MFCRILVVVVVVGSGGGSGGGGDGGVSPSVVLWPPQRAELITLPRVPV